jgi:hypothetical protein
MRGQADCFWVISLLIHKTKKAKKVCADMENGPYNEVIIRLKSADADGGKWLNIHYGNTNPKVGTVKCNEGCGARGGVLE